MNNKYQNSDFYFQKKSTLQNNFNFINFFSQFLCEISKFRIDDLVKMK